MSFFVIADSEMKDVFGERDFTECRPVKEAILASKSAKDCSAVHENSMLLFNSVQFWQANITSTTLGDTLLHFICSLPYSCSSEEMGQEKLFVSPTDSQLALKLALNDRKLNLKTTSSTEYAENEDSNSVLFVDKCEDSNSVVFTDKLSQISDSNFLKKVLLGLLEEEETLAFEDFLSANNKYDLTSAVNLFAKKIEQLKNDGRRFTIVLRCLDNDLNLHPLEVVVLNHIGHLIEVRKSDESSFDVRMEKCVLNCGKEMSPNHSILFSAWTAYLTLLVNSRCELSLARTLNVPDRELESTVFKVLKKSSLEKEMPMFQTALSLITQKRLGGKGYRPTSKNSLFMHIKGLGEYVDFVDRLRSHLEDHDLSPKVAIKRVLQSIQREFFGSKRSQQLKPFIDMVYDEMWQCLKEVCASNLCAPSPKTPNSGGTLAGREALKLLNQMVIKLNVIHSIRSVTSMTFVSENITLNHTPILDAFKSPAVDSNLQVELPEVMEEIDDESCNGQQTRAPKTPLMKSRKSQEINWAKTPETPFFGARDFENEDEEASSHVPLSFDEQNAVDDYPEDCMEKTIVFDPDTEQNDGSIALEYDVKSKWDEMRSKKVNLKIDMEKPTEQGLKLVENLEVKGKKRKSEGAVGEVSEHKKEKKQTEKVEKKKNVPAKRVNIAVKGQKTMGMFFKK